jgi:hypothetical protein
MLEIFQGLESSNSLRRNMPCSVSSTLKVKTTITSGHLLSEERDHLSEVDGAGGLAHHVVHFRVRHSLA